MGFYEPEFYSHRHIHRRVNSVKAKSMISEQAILTYYS